MQFSDLPFEILACILSELSTASLWGIREVNRALYMPLQNGYSNASTSTYLIRQVGATFGLSKDLRALQPDLSEFSQLIPYQSVL